MWGYSPHFNGWFRGGYPCHHLAALCVHVCVSFRWGSSGVVTAKASESEGIMGNKSRSSLVIQKPDIFANQTAENTLSGDKM